MDTDIDKLCQDIMQTKMMVYDSKQQFESMLGNYNIVVQNLLNAVMTIKQQSMKERK